MTTTQPEQPAVAVRPRRFWTPSFVLASIVLLAAAVGLNTVTRSMELYFKKAPVPLRNELSDATGGVSKQLGPWVMVSQDEPLNPDMEHALGTNRFAFRVYADSRVVSQEDLAPFAKQLTGEQRHKMIEALATKHPAAVMNLALTYYTGLADTVAHIPDRCMVADGYEPTTYVNKGATVGGYADGTPRKVEYRFVHFQDQTGYGRQDRNIAYFFHVNGGYESSPRSVRLKLQNLFERYGYYAKVEVMNSLKDETAATEMMNDILQYALPEVERCLPDWNEVKNQAHAKQTT